MPTKSNPKRTRKFIVYSRIFILFVEVVVLLIVGGVIGALTAMYYTKIGFAELSPITVETLAMILIAIFLPCLFMLHWILDQSSRTN